MRYCFQLCLQLQSNLVTAKQVNMKTPAIKRRRSAVAAAPSAGESKRMKIEELPQIAARSTSLIMSDVFVSDALAVKNIQSASKT